MADLDRIKKGIIAANKAGDENAVRVLGAEYRRLQSEQAAPEGQDYTDTGWGDVAAEAIGNIPSSAGQFASDIAQPFIHPIDTAKSLGNLALGAGQKLIPGEQGSEKYADAVGQFMADRYGSMEGFKKTLATDPVGVLGDASMLLTGGGAAAARAPGMLGKAGKVASKVGQVSDPAALAAKGAGKVLSGAGKVATPVVGLMSGTGAAPIKEAYSAGRKGGDASEAFSKAISGDSNYLEIVDQAKEGLAQMKADKAEAYKSGMLDISKDATIIDFNDVFKAFDKSVSENTLHGKPKSRKAAKALNDIQLEIDEWAMQDPKLFHTPEGLDTLKQRIGDLMDWNDPSKDNRAIQQMYHSVKGIIEKEAPVYGKVMGEYADASEAISDIEKALSLGKKSNADTALRKLTSVMRDNVNTNYGQRAEMADALQTASGKPLMPSIAGQSLSSWMPRGLAGTIPQAAITGAAGGLLSPWALATAPMQSPKVVGKAAQALGSTGRMFEKAAPYSQALGRGAFQAGRQQENPYLLNPYGSR